MQVGWRLWGLAATQCSSCRQMGHGSQLSWYHNNLQHMTDRPLVQAGHLFGGVYGARVELQAPAGALDSPLPFQYNAQLDRSSLEQLSRPMLGLLSKHVTLELQRLVELYERYAAAGCSRAVMWSCGLGLRPQPRPRASECWRLREWLSWSKDWSRKHW